MGGGEVSSSPELLTVSELTTRADTRGTKQYDSLARGAWLSVGRKLSALQRRGDKLSSRRRPRNADGRRRRSSSCPEDTAAAETPGVVAVEEEQRPWGGGEGERRPDARESLEVASRYLHRSPELR